MVRVAMKDHHATRDVVGKPFQLLNSIITGEDITPLPRGGVCKNQEEGTLKRNEPLSSPGDDTTTNPDLLFSPLNAGVDDGDEEDEYDHDFLSPVYFGAAYPKRFHRHGILTHVQPECRSGIVQPPPTVNESLVNARNEDFWREVGATDEEAICFPEAELANAGTMVDPLSLGTTRTGGGSCSEESPEDLTQFISEELSLAQPLDSSNWDQDCKIKLLCYRDAEGNLRLRNANSSSGNARIHKKSKRLLKRAIRRKSGVREMVSTGIGIGEFML